MSSVEDSDTLQLELNEDANLTEDTLEEEQVMQPTQRSGPGTGPKKLGKV